jgi:hypothetical protein
MVSKTGKIRNPELHLVSSDPSPTGRGIELDLLKIWLEEAGRSSGGMGLVSGAAGIGKSYLLQHLEKQAATLGFQVGHGNFEPGTRARLPWPWPGILRGFSGSDCARLSRELLTAGVEDSSKLSSDDGFLAGSGMQAGRLATRLMDALAMASEAGPLLIVCDDAHWCDRASLEVLRLVAEAAAYLPILIIAVARDQSEGSDAQAPALFDELSLEAGDRVLALGPLAADPIAEILGEQLVGELGGKSVAVALTMGNPLLATEMRRSSAQGTTELLRGTSLETGLSNLALRRLGALDTRERELAEAVSLGGDALDSGLLAEVLETGISDIESREKNPQLAGLMSDAKESSLGGVRVAHELLRDSVAESISPERRRHLHCRFARVLIDRRERDVPVAVSTIAHHALRAVPGFPGREAAAWAWGAATEANVAEAYASARGWVAEGLGALALDGGPDDRPLRLGLLIEGFSAAAVGNLGLATSRLEECARLIADSGPRENLQVVQRLVDSERGRSTEPGLLGRLIGMIDAARRLLPPGDAGHVALLARKASVLHRLPDRAARAECEELSMQALKASDAVGVEKTDRVAALATHLLCNVFGHTPAERLQLAYELDSIGEEVDLGDIAIISNFTRIVDSLAAGRPKDADKAIDQLSRKVAFTTNHPNSWYPFHLRAMRAAMRGDVAGARRLIETGIEHAAPGNYVDAASAATLLLAHLADASGVPLIEFPELPHLTYPALPPEFENLEVPVREPSKVSHPLLRPWSPAVFEVAERSAQAGSPNPDGASRVPIGAAPDLSQHWRVGYATVLSRVLDDPDGARAMIRDMANQNFSELPRDAQWLSSMCLAAQTCADLASVDVAEQILEILQPFANRHVVTTMGLVFCGSVAGFAAPLAFLTGDLTEAEALSEIAIRENDAVGAIFFAAQARLQRASFIYEAGGDDRREEAREFAVAGISMVQRHALGGLAVLAAQLCKQDPALVTTSDPGEDIALGAAEEKDVVTGIFRRSGDVWLLRWEGEETQLRNQRGLEFIEVLLARPHEEIHSRVLMATDVSAEAATEASRSLRSGEISVAGGDGMEVVDTQALESYRSRLTEAHAELEEARANNDIGRMESLQKEIDIVAEMVRSSSGLGGRRRKTGSDNERARVAVRKRIKAALDRIRRELPALHAHLAACLLTGTVCSYVPEHPTRWETRAAAD